MGHTVRGRASGRTSFDTEPLGVVLAGRNRIQMDDGQELEVRPRDAFHVRPCDDSWVVGDEPYVSLLVLGADRYVEPSGG